MKKKILVFIMALIMPLSMFLFVGCSQADTVTHNIQKDADKFNVYRKITFVNLYTNEPLYSAEGYFSVQTTYSNDYQGQQEIGLVFKVGANKYKMDYFSIDNNVAYVIEQTENTTTNPYHWKIVWYVALPDSELG
jgi:hypothetical protein